MMHFALKPPVSLVLWTWAILNVYTMFKEIMSDADIPAIKSNSCHLKITENGTKEVGHSFRLLCTLDGLDNETKLYWSLPNDTNVTGDFEKNSKTIQLQFHQLTLADIGNYSCNCISPAESGHVHYRLDFFVPVKLKITGSNIIEEKENSQVQLSCVTTGSPNLDSIFWKSPNMKRIYNSTDLNIIPVEYINSPTYRNSSLHFKNLTPAYNGTYSCNAGNQKLEVHIKVVGAPIVSFNLIKGISKSEIFVNWTINSRNSPIKELNLNYHDENNGSWRQIIDPGVNSYLLTNLTGKTGYGNFSLVAVNLYGNGTAHSRSLVTTLDEDPSFVPHISVKGYTSDTITLGWDIDMDYNDLFHFYNITVLTNNEANIVYYAGESPHLVEKLEPGTNYLFRVQACSNFTLHCGPASNEVNGTTMDGIASPPEKLFVQCEVNQRTQDSIVNVTWEKPMQPRGHIIEYTVTLKGSSTYPDENGQPVLDNTGPFSKTVESTEVEFLGHLPNTDISISVCGKTRSRRCGASAEGACSIPRSIPNKDELSKANWKIIQARNQMFFMVNMPYISQRNGTICCLRVIVVRLQKFESLESLESPDQLIILSYKQVHNNSVGGAYIAEMLDFPSEKGRNIMIGDNSPTEADEPGLCRKCWALSSINRNFNGSDGYFRRTSYKSPFHKLKNHHKRQSYSEKHQSVDMPLVHDGPLDFQSTYTAYLEAVVISEKDELLTSHSRYFSPLKPLLGAEEADDQIVHQIMYAIFASVIASAVLVTLSVLCVLRMRKKYAQDPDYDISSSAFLCCARLQREKQSPSYEILDLPPIPKDQLVSAYVEGHKNFDAGFKLEFESLPEQFSDRSTTESEKRENVGKNRYPDIKAYDETRVCLIQINKISTSDYINANFVEGYKARKRYICAQGPMESTVNDWWRMIWEQRVSLILMLTNTEEYNKTKCAKYWPSEGTSAYGEISVFHSVEKTFSDYLVRNLKLSCATEAGGSAVEEREVTQYHYLLWKDFLAPEHPIGIVKFIKRVNEVKCGDSGPVLVHCSAGVGRTGTLVALDSLLDQLKEEGCVSIFNTICSLRHQRNYLVQSLKQYIFVYRSLMEAVQFSDTEIVVSDLKSSIEKLKNVQDGKTTTLMQKEFESLSQVIEDRKPFKVGTSDENRCRNRYENIIPYDFSRVILSPTSGPNNEIYDYINASFIEGYDKSEQFIMVQDPLEGTVADFWKMVVEQSIEYIIMLSDAGEDKCPRYWPEKDQETNHDYIRVKYMQSQSFPFYYRREFTVTNLKTDDAFLVTQFQYNSWPTGNDAVPESPRGLVELVDTLHKLKNVTEANSPPMIVHCSSGADRSCVLVAFMILVQQIIKENRIDIFSVVRKLRSQRQGLFQNFAQYELIYRGLVTYTELHVGNGCV